MLNAADTIGVFQLESRAQMASLQCHGPERFYTPASGHESPAIRFREAAANGVGKADPAVLENISPAFFFSPFLR